MSGIHFAFPLPKGGGSIEAKATPATDILCTTRFKFPLPKGGGSIEAWRCSDKPALPLFPLPKGGGSIEAISRPTYHSARKSFHCRKAVAPLKHGEFVTLRGQES